MKFSQRHGFTPASKIIQTRSIDSDLRNSLWNALKILVFDPMKQRDGYEWNAPTKFDALCANLWLNYFKRPVEEMPRDEVRKEKYLRSSYFDGHWYESYDLIESVVQYNYELVSHYGFVESCNSIMERENSAYRFIDKVLSPITNSLEINTIEDAIESTSNFTAFNGANIHLNLALGKLSDRMSPDFRNSIKESISAVENVAKMISDRRNGTLGEALDRIKNNAKIHPSLERGFKSLYGYTSDADGIRHAIMDDTNCDLDDAKYMLVSCSAFINYMIGKANKHGLSFTVAQT